MADTVGKTELTRHTESILLSQALPIQSLDSSASEMGDRTSVAPDSDPECSTADLKDNAEDTQPVPTNTPFNLDFDTCYARFLNQSARSTSDGPREHRVSTSPRSPAPIDPAAAVHDFRTHYERFVGYSVDPQWFNGSATDPYRYAPKRRSLGLNLILRNGVLGMGSLIATGILGTVLLKAGSEGPQYSYREYSPDLFEQRDFTVHTPALDSSAEANSVPGRTESDSALNVELQSFVPSTTLPDVLRVPRYQVVMPDWATQLNEPIPATLGAVSDGSLSTSSRWDAPEVESALTVVPANSLVPSEGTPSAVISDDDTSSSVESTPVVPPSLSTTDVVIYNEIAFQSLTDVAPEASDEPMAESLKVFGGESAKQVEESAATVSAGEALESEN